jgi:catechol 2,3-dioxygenase-like lactoylglutathione lyase family enzyme
MEWNALVPELVVADYERSKAFYVDVFGFSVRFERPESRFGYFDLGGAQIMLQIEIPAISGILERLDKASIPLASDVVDRFYEYIGQR